MKGLIEGKTKILGPVAQEKLSGYGLGCLGGKLQNGDVNFYPIIGANISFSLEEFLGQVTVFRWPVINTGTLEYGLYVQQLDRSRNAIRDLIKNKLIEIDAKDEKKTKQIRIKHRQRFFNWLSSKGLEEIVKKVYEAGKAKAFAEYQEEFYVGCFVKSDDDIPSTFVTVEGLEWGIDRPTNSLKGINAIRLNKALWLAWRNVLGYKKKEACLEWLRLYSVYAGEDKQIDSKKQIQYILDELSQRPALKTVPEMASFIADQYITIALFNLTVGGLNPDNWYSTTHYNFIMYNISDKQMTAHIRGLVEEWQFSQVLFPTGGMSSKMEINVLPLWDGSTYESDTVKLNEPCLYFRRIAFDKDTVSEDEALTKTSVRRFRLLEILSINACADGEMRPNHIVYNRSQNKILSALPGDVKLSQIAVDVVFPWILGEEEPSMELTSLERRHWPLVFAYAEFDAPPVYSEGFAEAMLCGLRSFLGPKYYLVDFQDFLVNTAFEFTVGEDKTYKAAGNIFSVLNIK